MTISFDIHKEEAVIISAIVKRAKFLSKRLGHTLDVMSCNMDLTACHANGNPLRLQDLLDADDFNFSHDVFGISRHLDRETGKLEGFFSPRYTLNDYWTNLGATSVKSVLKAEAA